MFILELSNGTPFISNPLLGIFEFDQAKSLLPYGHKIVYCGVDLRSIRRRRKLGLTRDNKSGITVYNYAFPVGNLPVKLFNQIAWNRFKKVLKIIIKEQGKPDLIHAHFGRFAGVLALLAKKEFNIDYVVTEHDGRISTDNISDIERSILKDVYKYSLQNIAVSRPFREKLLNEYADSVTYVPNIVDTSAFKMEKREQKYDFVSCGSLLKDKNMIALVNAVYELKRRGIDAKLAIVGDGVEKENLERSINALGVSENVFLLGAMPREKVNEIFNESRVFVLASRHETFGVVYIEAMCTGIPVIATRCGGPESFVPDYAGVIVNVDDDLELVDAMERAYKDVDKYNALDIREYALTEFSPDTIGKKLDKIFRGLL